MAFAIGITFSAGRFHATVWGNHVNTGPPEWPPSPWRLLRSQVATWKRHFYSHDQVNRLLPQIIQKLLYPPELRLPAATWGHTRHYMPAGEKTLVFDPFIVLDPGAEVVFAWRESSLDESESAVMDLVLSRLSHFGRRESLCSAHAVACPSTTEINAWPICGGPAECPSGYEPVQVLCADPTLALRNDHTPKEIVSTGRGKKMITQQITVYDPDWHLCVETKRLRHERWSDPPGSQWITYYRRQDALTPTATTPSPRLEKKTDTYVTARFVLDGPVCPLVQETVYQAETARQFLQGVYGRIFDNEQSAIFSGKDPQGAPQEGHKHAFFLPTDEDGDGKLDHITVYCSEGFGSKELRALDEWRRVRRPGGGVDLNVMLTGLVRKDQRASAAKIPILSYATKWRSVTPFVLTRHYKKRGTKRDTCCAEEFPQVVLREEIARRGMPEPVRVEPLTRCLLWDHARRQGSSSGRTISWLQFRQERVRGNGRRGTHPGIGFVIEFPEPVQGPIALGYACHFGLGLFAPAD